MSKLKKIKLSIPTPCHEDWDKMTQDKQGRFCSNCQKSVVDFSTYTDRELLDYFTKAKDRVCGKFNNYQLERPLVTYQQNNLNLLSKLFFGGALAAGITSNVSGQTNAAPQQKQQVNVINKTRTANPQDSSSNGDSTDLISGIVVDEMHNPIPHTSISILKDTTLLYTFSSSDDGHFNIKVDRALLGKIITIQIRSFKYPNQISYVKLDSLPYSNLRIVLKNIAMIYTMGDVASTPYYIVDGLRGQKKPTHADSISVQDMLNKHKGVPAAEKGPQ